MTSFDRWMARVDLTVINETGLSIYDLPDAAYRDWFDSGVSATDAAIALLEDAGYQ